MEKIHVHCFKVQRSHFWFALTTAAHCSLTVNAYIWAAKILLPGSYTWKWQSRFFFIKVETHPYKDGQSNSDSRMQTNTSARERSVLKLSALTTNIIDMYIFSHWGHSDQYCYIRDIEYLMLNALYNFRSNVLNVLTWFFFFKVYKRSLSDKMIQDVFQKGIFW